MKKVLVAGMLAVCMIALSQQQASAWTNTRIGIGLNWGWSSGGNNLGWGLIRGAQPPGPELYQGNPSYPQYGPFSQQSPQSSLPIQVEQPTYQPSQAGPGMNYGTPYQFATYPRPVYYYYPAPYYSR
jgi:hypothetical protein